MMPSMILVRVSRIRTSTVFKYLMYIEYTITILTPFNVSVVRTRSLLYLELELHITAFAHCNFYEYIFVLK